MRKENFEIGISRIDISPSVGVELCGYAARIRGNVGLLDSLFVKTLAIYDGNHSAAIVSCDLIGLDMEIINFVKNKAADKIGIYPQSIMLTCSHTHSGPATLHNNAIGLIDAAYIEFLKEKMLESIVKAFQSLEPAELYYYRGMCDIGINRRGKIDVGSIEPSNDPNGYVDRQVSIIAFYSLVEKKKLCSILFNYGCHPTVLGHTNYFVSADFPGAACNFVENFFDNKITVIFINGGGGNVNPIDRGSIDSLKLNGEKLGKVILGAISTDGKKLKPMLSYNSLEVILPYAKRTPREELIRILKKSNVMLKKVQKGSVEEKLCKANINWANKYLQEKIMDNVPDYVQINLQGIRIGDICLIGIPGEVFAETAAWIKEQNLGEVIVASYANGNVGYISTKEEILKGGYEVLEAHKYYDRPSNFSYEADINIRNASIKLISKLLTT